MGARKNPTFKTDKSGQVQCIRDLFLLMVFVTVAESILFLEQGSVPKMEPTLEALEMLKEHSMYELRVSYAGSRYTLEATDLGRADGRWEYDSSDDLLGKLSDLGIAPAELAIVPPTGEPQDIVLSDHRFRGSVLAEVLGNRPIPSCSQSA